MPPWATGIVNDSASIPGNPIPLVLVSSFIFLHAECALCKFLQARRNNYPVTVHKHSNRVIMFWTGYYARVQ